MVGRTKSADHRSRIANSLKGKNQNIVECPYCKKSGGDRAMKRWHFDNCALH